MEVYFLSEEEDAAAVDRAGVAAGAGEAVAGEAVAGAAVALSVEGLESVAVLPSLLPSFDAAGLAFP